MGILSFLFKPSKVANDLFDKDSGHLAKFGAWIGNQTYTAEEKAEMTHKFVIDTLAENTDRSRARREISKMVIRFYLLLLSASGISYPFNPDWSAMLFNLATSGGLITLVGGVGAFFFGTHMLRSTKYSKE